MTGTRPKPTEQQNANLMALHRQLQELVAKQNFSSHNSKRPDQVPGAVLVIQGK